MSTVDNIFVLHGLITHFLNHGKKLYCAFIDYIKAFDYVVRDNLWFKLVKLGLRGNILDIIKSMYENVKSRVKFCNKIRNEFFCSLGVRQGECLSPLLFSLFLNDIEEQFILSGFHGIDLNMFKMFMLLYADDIVIFSILFINNSSCLTTRHIFFLGRKLCYVGALMCCLLHSIRGHHA